MKRIFDVNQSDAVWIDLFYPTIQYTEIVESEKLTIESAVSDVGGLLGLWLGASMITLIHLIWFLVKSIAEKL